MAGRSIQEIEIAVEVKARTPLALLIYDGSTEAWIPRSMIADWSPDTDDDFKITSIFLPEDFATSKGLT
jgi:hypothetical protein